MVLEVTCRFHARLVVGYLYIISAGLEVGTLYTQSESSRETLAQLLVEAQIAGCHLFAYLVVACLFLIVLRALILAEVDLAKCLL